MKQKWNKIKKRIYKNKKVLLFLLGISMVGFLSGSVFVFLLKKQDVLLVQEYLADFLEKVGETSNLEFFLSIFLEHTFFLILLWILGISILGIPISLLFLFFKCFLGGFSVTAFIATYHFKGCLFSFLILFPHHVFNFFCYLFLLQNVLIVSFHILYSIVKKKHLDFSFLKPYFQVFLISLVGFTFTSILEAYLMPFLFQTISSFL